jgi:hypothetical protein
VKDRGKIMVNIGRFAIIKNEHPCFGHFKEFDPECEICDACRDCEEQSDE